MYVEWFDGLKMIAKLIYDYLTLKFGFSLNILRMYKLVKYIYWKQLRWHKNTIKDSNIEQQQRAKAVMHEFIYQ